MPAKKRFLVDLTPQNHELLRVVAFKKRTTIKNLANKIIHDKLKGAK